jgi:MurNAc alpha-1-phosphate uridylyltransferase
MPAKITKAMVLAAGYGTRLKPLTDRMPKPLVPVAGRPMIEYALDRLKACGIEEVVINVSHLKEQLIAYVSRLEGLRVRISEEAEPLETGGGLKRALPLLGAEAFFAINSDIIWTDESFPKPGSSRGNEAPSSQSAIGNRQSAIISEPPDVGCYGSEKELNESESALARLAWHWDDAKMDVLLLAQSKARAVGHDQGEDHLFIKPGNTIEWDGREAPYIIAGVGIIHPRIFRDSPDGKFSVKVVWHQALNRNRLFCLPHHGQWFQTGTVEDITQTERALALSKRQRAAAVQDAGAGFQQPDVP